MPTRRLSSQSGILAFLIGATCALHSPALAQDTELSNSKSGIDVIWGGAKGSAYQEEYWYHDKQLWDTKTVFIRDNTTINMSHNERNVGTVSGRGKTVIGAAGGGQIRYQLDKLWSEKELWAHPTATKKPAYTAPFTLASQFYDISTPVVGTTGARPGFAQNDANFYWRGLVDSVGDEWHVLMYADDDQSLGSIYDDSWASDGKWTLLVVNPKTPALTVRKSGNAQFYTTPAWTYWVPKIHDQTTYIDAGSGTVSFEIHDIYGHNVFYRINNGNFINAGSSTAILTQNNFNTGINTLQYYYAGNESYVRTRKVVKNPTHPGLSENHGNRVWGGPAAWAEFQSRATRAPYSTQITAAQKADNSGQPDWDNLSRKDLRFGGSNWPHKSPPTSNNALMAKYLGFTAQRAGANKSYAQYAKEMLLESVLAQSAVGYEASYWAAMAIPAADTVYRGYWDVNPVYSAAITYDILMDGYRSDQLTGGITPIEDYFIRDLLASWVHLSAIQMGGFVNPTDTGMWTTSRNVGATMITIVMPQYSSSYYGTSGMDGNSTVFTWAPFKTNNYTWKDLFVDLDNPLGTYPEGPILKYGMEGGISDGALIREPGTTQIWGDKTAYASFSQCGHNIYYYANMLAMYGDINSHPILLNYIDQITKGILYGSKGDTSTPMRQHAITLLNKNFPTAAFNNTAWVQSLPTNDVNSVEQAMTDAGLMGIFFYDDTFYGTGSPNPTPMPGAPGAPQSFRPL